MANSNPILITGCARSGTSMVAGLINISGAYGGATCGATRYNKRGQFENTQIRNYIIKPYLMSMGYDKLGQNPLPVIEDLVPYPTIGTDIYKTILEQGYTGGPWFLKGAKLCLIWPVVHKAMKNAKWIIVRRKDSEIVNSCMNTGFMRKRSTPDEWQEWVDIHKQRFEEMKQCEGLQVREVWPEKFINRNFNEMRETVEWLGLQWKPGPVFNFVEPALWGNKTKRSK